MNIPSDISVILRRERVVVRHCSEADAEHAESQRQYAHVGHHDGLIICVARAFDTLPEAHQRGLIFHELGHLALIDLHPNHSEREADEVAKYRYRTKIEYRDSEFGRRLQWATPAGSWFQEDKRAARERLHAAN